MIHLQYILNHEQYTLIHLQYILNHKQYTLIHLQYILNHKQYTLMHLKYTLNNLQYTLNNLQYTFIHLQYTYDVQQTEVKSCADMCTWLKLCLTSKENFERELFSLSLKTELSLINCWILKFKISILHNLIFSFLP